MNNKGKIILVVFIGIIALVAIIGAAVLVNDIPSKMSVNGSYISTSEFASSDSQSSTTFKFNAFKGTFQQISDSGNIIQEGKYEVYDNIIKLSGVEKTSNSLDYETMYVWQALMKLWISNFIYQTISLFTNRMLSNRKKLWKVYLKMKNTVQYWHLCVH